MTPRGIRLNNPMNIRIVKGTTWEGQSAVQSDESFVEFTDPVYGIRAGTRILRSYEREGLQTIAEIIDRFAPPSENNSAAYVADVCEHCSVGPDEPIDYDKALPGLIEAIILREQGSQPYTGTQIRQGISLA